MAQRTEITLVCDRCGRDETDENPVATHEITVDGKTETRDACVRCWAKSLAGLSWVAGAVAESRRIGTIKCLDCDPVRVFRTERGLVTHLARAHANGNAVPVG